MFVVLTGAASGLGWELARRFSARGDHLLLLDRNAGLLEQRVRELAAPERVRGLALDIADGDAVTAFAETLCRGQPRIDVLVNNAGITHRSPAIRTRHEVLRQVMEVDYHAAVHLALSLYPAIETAQGSIVNIGSMAGWMPLPGRAAYCAAKGALHQFFETLRAEVRARGVHVLMVYPSFLDTPIEKNALGADGQAASHARSTTGQVRSADWMAERIIAALDQRRERVFPDRLSAFAALLYRVWPTLFHRLIRRRFAAELPA